MEEAAKWPSRGSVRVPDGSMEPRHSALMAIPNSMGREKLEPRPEIDSNNSSWIDPALAELDFRPTSSHFRYGDKSDSRMSSRPSTTSRNLRTAGSGIGSRGQSSMGSRGQSSMGSRASSRTASSLTSSCNSASRPDSAASKLQDLLGNTCIPKRFKGITIYKGNTKLRQRLDVEANRVIDFACGKDHMLFLICDEKGNETLKGLGLNWDKQIRVDWDKKPKKCLLNFSKPVDCDYAKYLDDEDDQVRKVTNIGACNNSSCIVYDDAIMLWSNKNAVYRFDLPKRVLEIAIGTDHVLIRCQGNDAYGFGDSRRGQLGPYVEQEPVGNSAPQEQEEEKEEKANDRKLQATHKLPILLDRNIQKIAAGFDFSYFARGCKVWSLCGNFSHTFDERVGKIRSGRYHTLALMQKSRKLYAWGSNDHGALGISRSTQPVGGSYDKPQLVNGKLGPLWHKCEMIDDIAAGEHHSLLLTDDGSVYVWGRVNRTEIQLRPQKVGDIGTVDCAFAGPNYSILVES